MKNMKNEHLSQEELELQSQLLQNSPQNAESKKYHQAEFSADSEEMVAKTSVKEKNADVVKEAPSNISKGLTDKIKQLEVDAGMAIPNVNNKKLASETYLDDYGNETFYVKNVSGGILIIGDMLSEANGTKTGHSIRKGEVVDLLQVTHLDNLKNSSDLRKQIYGANPGLLRLTQEQYFVELTEKLGKQKQIQALEAQKQVGTKKEKYSKPRPVIDSKLEKLNLYYDKNPELQIRGMEPIKFISWIADERFEEGEIDYILGHPRVMQNADIKAALIQKKKTK